jgi:hypothetical protein
MILNGVTSTEKLNISSSPDGSKYPLGLGFSPKDTVDSGSEVDEKPKTSAPKTKNTSLSTSVAKYLSGLTLSEFKTLKGLNFERVGKNN